MVELRPDFGRTLPRCAEDLREQHPQQPDEDDAADDEPDPADVAGRDAGEEAGGDHHHVKAEQPDDGLLRRPGEQGEVEEEQRRREEPVHIPGPVEGLGHVLALPEDREPALLERHRKVCNSSNAGDEKGDGVEPAVPRLFPGCHEQERKGAERHSDRPYPQPDLNRVRRFNHGGTSFQERRPEIICTGTRITFSLSRL